MEYGDIHRKIREIRRRRNITIQELSRKSGLTQGYLSKIENSPKPPPIPTLVKIAYALNVHVSHFFEDEQEMGATTPSIIREHQRKPLIGDYSELGYRYESVIEKKGSNSLQPLVMILPGDVDPETVPYNYHDGEEMIYVLEGQLDFFYGDETHRVSKGDSLFFNAEVPHKIVSAAPGTEVKVLSILSLN